MTIYIICFVIALSGLVFFVSNVKNRINNNVLKFILFLQILVISLTVAFRDMIGGYDIFVYRMFFHLSYDFINIFNYEKFYYFINVFISHLSNDNFYVFIFLISIFIYFIIYIVIKRNISLAFLLFFVVFCKFYFLSFVYIRQMLAVPFVWMAFNFLYNNNRNKYFLFLLIAIFFHTSALIGIIAIFVKNIKFPINKFLVIIIVLFIFAFSGVGNGILNIVSMFLNKGDYSFFSRNYFYLIESIIFFFFLFILFPNNNKERNLFFNLGFVYCCLMIIASTNATLVRISWYFFFPLCYYIFDVIDVDNVSRVKKLIVVFFIMYSSFIYFRTMIVWDGGDFIPYQTYFSDEVRPSRWNMYK
ncbi:EpsG family protein [Photobacterium carnosum]|uniref:EpsG family protein n=1 Tax=Photobacterium carnosum TaxID=2023717 RepID=UPI00242D40E7|nr:EpsG family protein [Photobacterium carnosum]